MKIGIIGAGASGMMAAIAAASHGSRGIQIILIEKNDRVGKKILATGNGRCNFTNKEVHNTDYYSQKEGVYSDYISQYNQDQVIAFFQKEGMLTKDRGGYCYPRSDQASTVLDILRKKLVELGVHIVTEVRPGSVHWKKGVFVVDCEGRKPLIFDRLILACGSFAGQKKEEGITGYDYARSLGHPIIPVVPALVQLRAKKPFLGDLKSVAGVRCDAAVTLLIKGEQVMQESGELQLTDYGISGIPVFQLSRHAAYGFYNKQKVTVKIDFLPEFSLTDLKHMMEQKWKETGKGETVEDFFLGLLNKKLNQLVIRLAGLKSSQPIGTYSLDQICNVCRYMKEWEVEMESTNPFQQAQVCAGGVSMDEIDLTMESKKIPGLYFAGEMLDVDGRCGGFNLQWAWTSGYLAGKSAAEKRITV